MDGITLYAILHELKRYLPLKVQKIYQPLEHELSFTVWNREGKKQIVLSLEGNRPFLGFSTEKKKNPLVPSGFCLGLRKRLEGGTLEEIRQEGIDRIAYLEFSGHDDLGNTLNYIMVFDMAGNRSNVGLFRDGVLELSMKCPDGRRFRTKEAYIPPCQDKLNLLSDVKAGEIEKLLLSHPGPAYSAIFSTIAGMGKELALSVLSRAGLSKNEWFSQKTVRPVTEILLELGSSLKSAEFTPSVYLRDDGEPVFHVFHMQHLRHIASFRSVLEAASRYRVEFLSFQEYRSLKNQVNSLYKRVFEKTESKYFSQKQDYEKAKECEKYRVWAELINATGKDQPRGHTEIKVLDYYQNPPVEITVPLNPQMSSRENAKMYYAKYSKLVRTEKMLKESLKILKSRLEKLGEIKERLAGQNDFTELVKIYSELEKLAQEAGIKVSRLRRPSQQMIPKAKLLADKTFHQNIEIISEPGGFKIFVGNNARENDYLVRHVRKPGDIWLHAKGVKGAHILLRPPTGGTITDEMLLRAAKIAAERSEARNSSKVEVDWVDARNVRKPKGATPGFVVYTGQKTVVVPRE